MFQRATSYARASLSSPAAAASEPRFSLLKVSAAQPPDRPSQHEKQARQRPCPSSFRGPLGLSSSGDSMRHQPVLLHSALSTASLLPATTLRLLCAYNTTDPFATLRNAYSCLTAQSDQATPNTTSHQAPRRHHSATMNPES
jgi:hypothetical protein